MPILFQEDIEKFPGAIIDYKTKNVSFLRYSALLRDMKVKNHTWPLMLLNPELQGIDPFDPNLTTDQMVMIAVEAKLNFFWFIREVAKAPGTSGGGARPFIANRGNMALFWLFFNHITTILIQIRQTGKSFSTDVLMTYLMNLRCTNTGINLLTKDETVRSANIERLKDIESELPWYLKQRTKADLGNTEEITIRALGNSYRGHLPSKSGKQALNVGRGLTSPIFHIDEAAFLYNIAISLPAALAAGTAARDAARMNGEPYGTILTTTAGKKDDRDGRYIFQLLSNSAIWTEGFYDAKDLADLQQMIRRTSPSGELRVNCTFNHRQLGYSDEWLKTAIEDAVAIGDDADRDFFNKWTSGSQLSPLPIELADMIRNSHVMEFYARISPPWGYVTRWFIPEADIPSRMRTSQYVISVDSSDAVGGDDIGLTLRDTRTGEVVAAGNYNETNLITFTEWLLQWLLMYDNVTMIIERRSTGAMILDYLILMLVAKGLDPFKRLYNKVVDQALEFPERFAEINKPMFSRDQEVYTRYKKTFGFATSGTGTTSRTELYSTTLINAAKQTGDKVRDGKTIDQILGLVVRNGRVDHQEGEHDDNCISWLLGFWMITQSKNLEFYGISSKDVLSATSVKKEVQTPSQQYFQEEQRVLRMEIERLIEEIKKERDDFIVQKLEMKLVQLSQRLVLQSNEKFSVDALMQELKDQRRLNRIVQPAGGFGVGRAGLTAHSPNYYSSNMFGQR